MTTGQKIINNLVVLLELANQLSNVSQACSILGYSRESCYSYKELYDMGDEATLADISKKTSIDKNRVAKEVDEAAVEFAFEKPAYG